MKEYTEEFYKINLRARYIEDTVEKVSRYLNGLRYDIQDELSLVNPTGVDEAYQYALWAEERMLGGRVLEESMVLEAKEDSPVAGVKPSTSER